MPDVSVIVVSYCSRAELPACLESLAVQASDTDIEVFLVDNASTDGSVEYVEESFPWVRIIRSDRNLGFAAANNAAIGQASGRYIFLLNPDTAMESGSLGALVQYMDAHSDVGVSGPRLLNDDGTLQHSIGHFPTVANQLGHHLGFGKIVPRTERFAEIDRRPEHYETAHSVDWMYGAALIVRRQTLDDVGLLDERFFMFSEEKDWCLRAWRSGWQVHFVPESRVMHTGRGGPGSPEVYWMFVESRLKFIRKHHGWLPAVGVRILTIVGLALKYTMYASRALGGRDSVSKSRARAYRVSLARLVSGGGSA